MLPQHRSPGLRGAPPPRKVAAVGPGDRRVLVRRPHRCHGHPCWPPRSLGKRRPGPEVRDGPPSPVAQPSMGGSERLQDMGLLSPQAMGCDRLRPVLVDRRRGLAMMACEGEEVVASVREALLGATGWASHGLQRAPASLAPPQRQACRHRRARLGGAVGVQWATDAPTSVRPPGRAPGEWGRCRRSLQGRVHGLALQRDAGSLGERRDGPGPGAAACRQGRGMEAGQDPAAGSVRGQPIRAGQEGWPPGRLALATACPSLAPFASGPPCASGHDPQSEQARRLRPLKTWGLAGTARLAK